MAQPMKLEQGRAEFAYKCAEAGVKYGSDYKSYVKKIPMMIKTNGLGATVAFVHAKSKGKEDNAYGLIYKQMSDWIKKEKKILEFENRDFAKKLTLIDSAEYRFVTIEMLAFFAWLRRFAEGLILK